MSDRETVRAAQQAFEDADIAMEQIEELLEDVVFVLGGDETAAWLSVIVSQIVNTMDCEGEA